MNYLSYLASKKLYKKIYKLYKTYRYISEVLPKMETTGFMVTDYEVAFINALKKYFLNMPLLRCWKHLWGSIEKWVMTKVVK